MGGAGGATAVPADADSSAAGLSTSKGWGMAAEIGRDPGFPVLARGVGFGRGGGPESLADRREAAQRRLSSSVRAAELVACALRAFDEAMAEHALPDPDGSLRASVRATLTIAYDRPGFDVSLVPAPGALAVRVRHTPFGPEAEVLELPPATQDEHGSADWPAELVEETADEAVAQAIDLRDPPAWWTPDRSAD
jgi:hypothetical protein